MNAIEKPAEFYDRPLDGEAASPGMMTAIGQWTIYQLQGLVIFISIAGAAFWQSCRLLTWRRTVRAEFLNQCHQIGTRALPFIVLTALIIGLGVVFETLYWLRIFGQSEFAGSLLVIVLVREIAPLLVALIVIGRSVSVFMIELGIMQADGQIRMLDAQGIDPFIYILVPRVMAASVCMFSLTIVFTVVTLATGFVAGNALSATNLTVYDFVFEILTAMGPADFAAIPLTTLPVGYVTGLVGCTTGLSFAGIATDVHHLLPAGIMKAVIATLLISVVVTILI
jgi:phospholipid/cholesterol/gamma-HCH transport system permease protein